MRGISDGMKRINSNTLKVIACLVMLLDHLTAGIMLPVVKAGLYPDDIPFEKIKLIYDILRAIGRNAFPIFCFLIVEGFIHTKSRLRYALSLLLFGLISEPFFDVTFFAKKEVFNINFFECLSANLDHIWDRCNVYFTLLIGLLVIWAADFFIDKLREKFPVPLWVSYTLAGLSCGLGILVAERIHSDYHGFGVGLIFIFYLLRYQSPLNLVAGYLELSFLGTEYYALPSFVLLYCYNHKRGRKIGKLKYLFYAFYPVHIFLIYVLRCLMYG
ncbi:TraX family protein [Butyrivibrio sp. FCS006]|uniref:TraX family protein n=1 Tax=Butyrivibrio sp. FCS006 TaxID=1280684 RepID=UPI00041C07C3|nr:TraX family protein [Butyrivibrio sp. FCS006]